MAGYLTQALNIYGLIHLTYYSSQDILKGIRASKQDTRAANKADDTKPTENGEEEATSFHILELWLTKW